MPSMWPVILHSDSAGNPDSLHFTEIHGRSRKGVSCPVSYSFWVKGLRWNPCLTETKSCAPSTILLLEWKCANLKYACLQGSPLAPIFLCESNPHMYKSLCPIYIIYRKISLMVPFSSSSVPPGSNTTTSAPQLLYGLSDPAFPSVPNNSVLHTALRVIHKHTKKIPWLPV